jgi:CRISPR-associated protein Cmr2
MNDQSQIPEALLIFSIGPVQDFIAAARRTQDLWMGSFLLAYLASRALKVMQKAGAQVLYPALQNQPLLDPRFDQRRHSLATLPNKFTIAVGSLDEGEALARQAEEAVRDAWHGITQAVRSEFHANLRNTPEWDDMWTAQTKKWLEIYWAITPRDALPADDQVNYGVLHSYAQRAFDARKGLRNFVPAEEREEKCTVCAIRSALRRAAGPRRDQRRYWRDVAAAIRRTPGLYVALDAEGNERLCAICTVKRFAQRFYFEPECGLKTAFPSTSSVATVLFRRNVLEDEQRAAAAGDFVQLLAKARGQDVQTKKMEPLYQLAQSGLPVLDALDSDQRNFTHYDGDLLFEETYTQRKMERDYGLRFDEQTLAGMRAALGQLIGRARLGQPPRYYAVLAMDGDKMGEKLNQMGIAEEQRAVSDTLRLFTIEVQRIVEDEGGGRVVYAGGDDVLALLPLGTVLKTADDLRRTYEQLFHQAILADKDFALSGGIAIAHHQAPLYSVLAAAREAEHAAKDLYDRDALCIVALKRSGEPLRVGAHWQEKDVSCDTLTLVDHLYKHFRASNELSSRFAYEAHAQAHGLALQRYQVSYSNGQSQVTWEQGVPQEALESALRRLAVQRHRGPDLSVSKAEDLAKDLAKLAQRLDDHWRRWIENWYKHHQCEPQLADAQFAPHPGAEEMGRWLLLARFLERGGEQ